MRSLECFGLYLTPDGMVVMAETNDPDKFSEIPEGLLATLTDCAQYEAANTVSDLTIDRLNVALYKDALAAEPGHIYGYNVTPDGFAYAERATGDLTVQQDQHVVNVGGVDPASVCAFLETHQDAIVYEKRSQDETPAFHIDALVPYDHAGLLALLVDIDI